MIPFRRLSPPLAARPGASSLPRQAATLALVFCPLFVSAQTVSDALQASDPMFSVSVRTAAATPPVTATALELPTTAAEALAIWQKANQQVAAFPRGHIDILRRENGQTATPPAPASGTPATPLLADETLRIALTQRPDLLAQPGMSTMERAAVWSAWLAQAQAVHRAWIGAVANRESLRHQQTRLEAAQSGAELGRRMVVAGNWSQARLLREQLTLAREQAAAWQAAQSALEAEELLARLMGQWNPQAINDLMQRLPLQLPELPVRPRPAADVADSEIEAAVLRNHPTLAVQRAAIHRELHALSPNWRDTWTQSVQASLRTLPHEGLPTAALAITDPRLANDHALQRALTNEAALLQTATDRRSAARTAWARLQTTHALARHAQDVTLPLQTSLEQETLLRYNGMLQSTWELLEASRERMQAAGDAAAARRDFWLARLDLDHLLAGGEPAPTDTSPATGGARRAASTAGH